MKIVTVDCILPKGMIRGVLCLALLAGFAASQQNTSYTCVENLRRDLIISNFQLTCPNGLVITEITFASVGAPSGTCDGNDFISQSCAVDPDSDFELLQQKVDSTVR